MYAPGEGPRWLSQDYKSGKFEDGFVLPKEKLPESMIEVCASFLRGWLGVFSLLLGGGREGGTRGPCGVCEVFSV